MQHFRLTLADETATLLLGGQLAQVLHPGLVIFLRGDLGAGKTTFARGILRGLGYEGKVKSPTYNLIELYKISKLYLYHFDFYRFEDPAEWEDAGFREYFNAESICLVEWPEKAGDLLSPPDLHITLDFDGPARLARLEALSASGRSWLSSLQPR